MVTLGLLTFRGHPYNLSSFGKVKKSPGYAPVAYQKTTGLPNHTKSLRSTVSSRRARTLFLFSPAALQGSKKADTWLSFAECVADWLGFHFFGQERILPHHQQTNLRAFCSLGRELEGNFRLTDAAFQITCFDKDAFLHWTTWFFQLYTPKRILKRWV